MRTWAATRSRLPPEPWLRSTAVRLRDGTYQADSSPPVRGLDRDLLVGDAERGLLDRPARRVRDPQGHRERHHHEQGDDGHGGEPAGAVGEPPAERTAARRPPRRGDRGQAAAAMRRRPPAIMPTPVTSAQSGPEFTTWRPCEMTPKPSVSRPIDDAEGEPGRPRDVRPGQRPRDRDRRRSRARPGSEVSGPEKREVEQVERDEGEPGEQERALEPGEALAAARRPRGDRGRWGGGR